MMRARNELLVGVALVSIVLGGLMTGWLSVPGSIAAEAAYSGPLVIAPWSQSDAQVRFDGAKVEMTLGGRMRVVAFDDPNRLDPALSLIAAVSPNGQHLLYVSARDHTLRDAAVTVVDIPSLRKQVIANIPAHFWPQVRWSPDSQHIAFAMVNAKMFEPDIYVMDVNGAHAHRVIAGGTLTRASLSGDERLMYGWTQDGRSLLYYDNALTPHVAYTVSLATGTQSVHRLASTLGSVLTSVPSTPCTAPILEQINSPWSNDTMQYLGDTIASQGCALTAATMLADYYGSGSAPYPDPGHYTNHPVEMNECLGSNAEPLAWGVVASSCSVNTTYDARWDCDTVSPWKSFDWSDLNAQLNAGHPTIVGVNWQSGGSHFFLVVAGDGSDNPANYVINNPLNSARQTMSAITNAGGTLCHLRFYHPNSGTWPACVTGGATPPRMAYLDANGNFYAQEGPLSTNWTLEAGGVTQFALAGDRIGVLQTNGNFSVKEGSLSAQWNLEATNAIAIALATNPTYGDRIGFVDTNYNFYVKEGGLGASWDLELSGGIGGVALSGTRIAVLGTNGAVYVKDGDLNAQWTTQMSGGIQAMALTTDPTYGDRIGVLSTDGYYYVKEGALNAQWSTQLAGGAIAIALSGTRIGAIGQGGAFYVKDGDLNAQWTTQVSSGAATIALSGTRIGLLGVGGTAYGKDGSLNAQWTTVVTSVAIAIGLQTT